MLAAHQASSSLSTDTPASPYATPAQCSITEKPVIRGDTAVEEGKGESVSADASSGEPQNAVEGNDGERPHSQSREWLQRLNLSLTLQNSGSVARDHLAVERTFLAYVRTSLTIASSGIALVQVFAIATETYGSLDRFTRPLGGTMVMLGIITLLVGAARFFILQRTLVEGNFPVARISPAFLAIGLLSMLVVVFSVAVSARAGQ
ncbi:hypothetical protein K474DRAFT_1710228 [Panus rudis PR-1116 ss-1]|nr:hypothetical protein K474DRAFT_1710228 [Panus rudis PR-1116 ss-1]